jgi:hypothetical protein
MTTRLPTHKNSHIEELLPHRWQPLLTWRLHRQGVLSKSVAPAYQGRQAR